jgi:tellurite resistance protein
MKQPLNDIELAIIINRIIEVAESDSVFSEEEDILVRKIIAHSQDYISELKKALEDGTITPDEQKRIQNASDKILKEAQELAEADGEVTTDEQKIINSLFQLMKASTGELDYRERVE